MRRDLAGDDAVFNVLLVRQAEMSLGLNVAEHRQPNQPIIAAPPPLLICDLVIWCVSGLALLSRAFFGLLSSKTG